MAAQLDFTDDQPAATSWTMASVRYAQEMHDRLEGDAEFAQAIAAITRLAARRRLSSIVGVSDDGRRLASAALRDLGSMPEVAGPRRVLFVDGMANTGVNLALAIRRALVSGAEAAEGVAICAQSDVESSWAAEGVCLHALSTLSVPRG